MLLASAREQCHAELGSMENEPSPKVWPTLPSQAPPSSGLVPEGAAHLPPPVPVSHEQDEEERERHRRRRRHGHGTHFRRGRMWVIGVFCGFRMVDVFRYLLVSTLPGGMDRSWLHSSVITAGIWTTVLLTCIWLRQAWARYFLIVLVLLDALREIVWLPETLKEIPDSYINPFLIATSIIHAAIAYVLISVPSVRRLTNKSYA